VSDKVKMLDLKKFAWDKNDFSSSFKGCQLPTTFVQIFNDAVSQDDASTLMTDDTTLSASSAAASSPPSKRPKIATLIPASHSARSLEGQRVEEDYFDITRMDKTIQTYFQGNFMHFIACND